MAAEAVQHRPPYLRSPGGRPVTHKIYRDAAHPSRLVLPFTTRMAEREG
ncbi:hypothetical protein ACPC39_15510 [Streptomyces cellulosae]